MKKTCLKLSVMGFVLFLLLSSGMTAYADNEHPKRFRGEKFHSAPCGEYAPATFIAGEFLQAFPVHGVAGDHAILFAAQPSEGIDTVPNVYAMRRIDGEPVGQLQPPPEGWGVPLSLYITQFKRRGILKTRGEIIISDVRIPPSEAMVTPEPAKLYRYRYAYSVVDGFSSELIETGTLPVNTVQPGQGLPDGLVYLGSYTILPSGHIVISDTLAGSLWIASDLDGPWTLTLIDSRFAPAPVSDIEGIQRAPGGGVQPYFLQLPAPPGSPSIGPGIESITFAMKTDKIYTVSNAQGGIYSIPRSAVLDLQTPPFAKSDAVQAVVDPIPGLTDSSDGIVFDRFHPNSPWLYWHRAPSDATDFDGSDFNTLRRVNLVSGEIEEIAKSNTCFDWTFEISALPPIWPNSPFTNILSSMGQGPNNPELNMALQGQISYVALTLMPITFIPSW
jgi:hypothetical protein